MPFTPGRTDATEEQTDADSFEPLEPRTDGFRNYVGETSVYSAEELLVDRAHLLGLTAPEMTVLVGGLRVLGANHGGSHARRVHRSPRAADQRLLPQPARDELHGEVGGDRTAPTSRAIARRARRPGRGSRVDLIFGSNSQLRALSEVYAADDASGELRRRLRQGLDEGHGRRSLRAGLNVRVRRRGTGRAALGGERFSAPIAPGP